MKGRFACRRCLEVIPRRGLGVGDVTVVFVPVEERAQRRATSQLFDRADHGAGNDEQVVGAPSGA
jgi:hypothetical protein